MRKKAPNRETGRDVIVMRVERKLPRNSKTTKMVKRMP
jgi:hypothetical protein